jgi:hypothetical protein
MWRCRSLNLSCVIYYTGFLAGSQILSGLFTIFLGLACDTLAHVEVMELSLRGVIHRCCLSLKEEIFLGQWVHVYQYIICIFIDIIYFLATRPNELATVAFLACEGFSHRVFPLPHEGFDATVFVGVEHKYQGGDG